jgi:lysophospholipase L1-like esterase
MEPTGRPMHPLISAALHPPTPGRLVRLLAPIAPGIRTTRDQIKSHGDYWKLHAEAALDAAGDERATVVVLGDSLSQAVGASEVDRSWLHRLAQHESRQRRQQPSLIVNLSRSGARIDDVIRVQLPAFEAIERPVKLVTCTVGSNDLARGASLSKVERSMHSLMARLPAGAILATLPAKGSLMAKRLNRVIRAEAGRAGLVVADVDAHLPGWRGRSAGDRFHPNDLGYEAWFDAFAEGDAHQGDASWIRRNEAPCPADRCRYANGQPTANVTVFESATRCCRRRRRPSRRGCSVPVSPVTVAVGSGADTLATIWSVAKS